MTAVEGELPSNERIERARGRDGWEKDEWKLMNCIIWRFVIEEHITWVGKGRKAGD